MSGESEICDTLQRVGAWFSATTPRATAFALDRIMSSIPFDAAEEAAVAGAVALRREEFTTGRRLAREALARLGAMEVGLPPDCDRVPQWPEGFVGSISHSGGLCAALVGRAGDFVGIGVDIERTIWIHPELKPLICRPDEIDLDKTDGASSTLLRFVAKEAFFKAYFPPTRTFLDFLDVNVSIDRGGECFEVRLMKASSPSVCGSRTFAGRLAALGNYAVAAVWITQALAPGQP